MTAPATVRAVDAFVEAAELAARLGVLGLALDELAEWADGYEAATVLDQWATDRVNEMSD